MSDRPLILVTNDDGILAEGLAALANAAERCGDVVVVAPDREMSAVSHALTLHAPLRAVERKPGWFAISGTPADCTLLGVHQLTQRRPDLVLSGINHGPNLGCDVLYSGTVAGAREGAMQGLPAIAFSLVSRDTAALDGIADIIAPIIQAVLDRGLPKGITLNVNVPAAPTLPLVYEACRLGRRDYEGGIVRRKDPRGREYLWIGGGIPELEDAPGTDTAAVRAGRVAVTPLPLFAADEAALAEMETWTLFAELTDAMASAKRG